MESKQCCEHQRWEDPEIADGDTPRSYRHTQRRRWGTGRHKSPGRVETDGFHKVKTAIRGGRMQVACCSVYDAIKVAPPNSYTVASLLDHLDWLDNDSIEEEMETISARLNKKNGRIFWRSFSEKLPKCDVLRKLNVSECDAVDDRMPWYWGCWVAKIN